MDEESKRLKKMMIKCKTNIEKLHLGGHVI